MPLPQKKSDPARPDWAAAFASVPWEIAGWPGRAGLRNLVIRTVVAEARAETAASRAAARAVAQGESLRVLAVFSEAPGSVPLAMRKEREELRKLFAEKILPGRYVELDILCHGVTRLRLKEAIRSRSGYHVVHWSGHGHHDTLELQGEKDNQIDISVSALAKLLPRAGVIHSPV